MEQIIIDNAKQNELTVKGYTQFKLLNSNHIEQLQNYYQKNQSEEPQHFYSSSHSSNFEFRKQTSEFIKQLVEPLVKQYLINYKLLGGAFVVKPANGKGILQAHQDWNLVDESKNRSYNLWIPLIDVNEQNGAVYVLPNSHTKLSTYRGPNIPSVFKNIEQELWPYLTILPMQAGQALLYDHALLHCSPPNNTNVGRLGIVIGLVNKNVDIQIYGNDNGKMKSYQCDEDFFLSRNTITDYSELPVKSVVTETQKELTLNDFKEVYLTKHTANNNLSTINNTDTRTFFEKYTIKNIITEINYRLFSKTEKQLIIDNKIEPIKIESKKDVAKFYNDQTDNFLKVYGDVIQAFRTKNVSILLDYQIQAIGLTKNSIVLDAGCGVCGPATYFVKQTNCKINAITISQKQVELATKKITENNLQQNITVQVGDYHQLENYYSTNYFDTVYFLESFGHALNHEQVLHSVWNVLKPGGVVYIKDLFIKKAPFNSLEEGIEKEVQNINTAYHYNVPDLNYILDIVRKKGYILSSLKTIDIPLSEFENLTISNDFQELTGINKIENLREYVFPIDFFELKLIKPCIDLELGNSRYFLQNMYLMQIENWKEKDL